MAYSLDFRLKAVRAYLNGEGSQEQIAKDFRINRGTLQTLVARYKDDGDLTPRPITGRPGKLKDHKDTLRQLVKEFPGASEVELVDLLEERVNIKVHRSAIGYHLRRMGLTLKKNLPRP